MSKCFIYFLGRQKRSTVQYGIGWPPQSYDNTVEVLVVVDSSMIHYHKHDVKNYVLNLMKMVSFRLPFRMKF